MRRASKRPRVPMVRKAGPNAVWSEPLRPAVDAVNHPAHYNASPSGVECITIIEHLTFNVGSAIKYLWRAGLKNALVEDLKKARWYIDREIARIERP